MADDDLLQENETEAAAQPKRTRVSPTKVAPLGTHIQMTRDREVYPAPHTAEVHRDEIDNWAKHGWERAD